MSPSLYKKILVGSDGSKTAEHAIDFAATMAGGTAAVAIIGAVSSERERGELEAKLDASVQRLAATGLTAVARVDIGDPSEVILAAAEEIVADLIVVGNKGMGGVRRFILAPVPDKVSHRAHCSVLIANTTA